MHMTNIFCNKKRRQAGVAATELVLVMPFIIIILLGAVDLARTIYQYNTLVKNVRDATKYMAIQVRPIGYASNTDYATRISEAKNLAVCGSIATCSIPSAPDLTTGNVEISYPATVNGVTMVRVAITDYTLGFVTNLFGANKTFGDIQLTMHQLQQSP